MISEITTCVNTPWCTVCGLLFDTVCIARIHAREALLCKHNLLLRGPVCTDDEVALTLDIDAKFKSDNSKKGVASTKRKNACIRSFGPYQPAVNFDGVPLVPSKKGHPLGGGRGLCLPRRLIEHVEEMVLHCPASRYRLCTVACGLCRGR